MPAVLRSSRQASRQQWNFSIARLLQVAPSNCGSSQHLVNLWRSDEVDIAVPPLPATTLSRRSPLPATALSHGHPLMTGSTASCQVERRHASESPVSSHTPLAPLAAKGPMPSPHSRCGRSPSTAIMIHLTYPHRLTACHGITTSPSPAAVTVTVGSTNEGASQGSPLAASEINYDSLFRSKARPLGVGPNPSVVLPRAPGLSGALLSLLGYYSKESEQIRAARAMYKEVQARADDQEFLNALSLPVCFRSHHSLLTLHLWLCLRRLRAEGKEGAVVGQTLYDLFNHDTERRVVEAGVKLLVGRWMRELEKAFYGACLAFDNATTADPTMSEELLPQALWRNVFSEDASEMPTGKQARPVKALTRYVRRELASLAMTDSDAVLTGHIRFSSDF